MTPTGPQTRSVFIHISKQEARSLVRVGNIMILTNPFVEDQTPRYDVETILRRHGIVSVLVAFSASVVTGSHRNTPDVAHLSDHLRRDIGLAATRPSWHPPDLMR